jgi:predicted RNA binding protein YcfA (HicA-like mRNA interferase family)
MKLPRDLSGEEVAAKLCRRWDYAKVSQAGSHILLETETPSHQRVVIPAHKAVKVGTLGNIFGQLPRTRASRRKRYSTA